MRRSAIEQSLLDPKTLDQIERERAQDTQRVYHEIQTLTQMRQSLQRAKFQERDETNRIREARASKAPASQRSVSDGLAGSRGDRTDGRIGVGRIDLETAERLAKREAEGPGAHARVRSLADAPAPSGTRDRQPSL